jgi:hypothetical protein
MNGRHGKHFLFFVAIVFSWQSFGQQKLIGTTPPPIPPRPQIEFVTGSNVPVAPDLGYDPALINNRYRVDSETGALIIEEPLILPKAGILKNREDRIVDIKEKQYPLTPEELRLFQDRALEQERALREKNIDRKIKNIEGNPSQLMTVYLAPGNATTLLFFDSFGNSWPIDSYTISDQQGYTVSFNPNRAHIITIASSFNYGSTTIAILMKNSDLPYIFVLENAKSLSDSLVRVRLSGKSPTAAQDTMEGGFSIPEVNNAILLSLVDNIAPKSLVFIESNPLFTIWRGDDGIYIRTKIRIVSPSAAVARGVDGFYAYRLPFVNSFMYLHSGGMQIYDLNPKASYPSIGYSIPSEIQPLQKK